VDAPGLPTGQLSNDGVVGFGADAVVAGRGQQRHDPGFDRLALVAQLENVKYQRQ